MANPNLVNVATINGGNLGFNLSATTTATLLTVDADKILKINRITVANVDGTNAADLNIDHNDGSTTAALVSTLSVPADSAVNPIGGKLVLEAADTLTVDSDSNNSVDVTLTIMETT